MSRSKDHYGHAVGSAAWSDVTGARRCPVCNGATWCQVARDGATVLCKRDASGRPRTSRDGATYYVHHLAGATRRVWQRPPVTTADRAPVDVRDRAYGVILAQLRLDDADRRGLRARGLSDDAIDANGYRSLPVPGRAALARAALDAVGEDAARGVPGLVWREDDGRGWWSFAGCAGLLIPCRNLDGAVVALKIRRAGEGDGPRYLYVTSAKHGGASAAAAVHVPLAARARRATAPRLVITEGELKADTATHLARVPVVSVPGVGQWRDGVDLALAWRADLVDVDVCFDMDAHVNVNVARGARALVDALRAEGLRPTLRRWDPRFKGLDDFLLARQEVTRARG